MRPPLKVTAERSLRSRFIALEIALSTFTMGFMTSTLPEVSSVGSEKSNFLPTAISASRSVGVRFSYSICVCGPCAVSRMSPYRLGRYHGTRLRLCMTLFSDSLSQLFFACIDLGGDWLPLLHQLQA